MEKLNEDVEKTARKMSELKTRIEHMEEGRRIEVAEWRGKLAKALMKITEQKIEINRLEHRVALLTGPKD